MPPAPKSTTTQNRNVMIKRQPKGSQFAFFYKKYVNFEFIKYLLFDPVALPIVAIFIILAELVLNVVVIQNVPYTEIDWIAYMQECEGFLNGTTNYALLKGDTGPLVYPAGFVYIYSALYFITSQGHNIRLAQYIFCVIYLLQIWLVMRLYSKSGKVPPYVLVLSTFTSYRIHSIYVLRLFNDPVAILFLFAALNLFLEQRWTFGSVCYSLGVAVKMNILLFAPALFLLYITNLGYRKTFQQLLICACVQIVLGLPFLLSYPLQYLRGGFDLGRVFEHKWTVNYRFLDRNIFENNLFHLSLLIVHIGFLVLFAKPTFIFFKNYCRLRELQQQLQPQINRKNLETKKIRKPAKNNAAVDEEFTKEQMDFLNSFENGLKMEAGKTTTAASSTPIVTKKRKKEDQNTNNVEKYSINFDKCTQLALLPLLLSNFIGIVCARSLHYQFYVWYFHSLPYLTWSTDYTLGVRYLLLGLIEFCWNTYPSTHFSSVLLHWCHLVLLYGVGRKMFVTAINSESAISKEAKQEKSLETSTSRNERKSD